MAKCKIIIYKPVKIKLLTTDDDFGYNVVDVSYKMR